MAEAKYVVEYARSANSVCKSTTCEDKNINDGELRLGKLVNTSRAGTTAYNTTEKMLPNWYHPKCMFEMLKKAQKSTKMLFSGEDFHFGWDQIKVEDQQLLQSMIDQLKIDRETPKTKKRPISDEKVKTPSKKQKTHQENNNHSIMLVEDNWNQILSFVPSHHLRANVLYVSKTFFKLAAQQICQKGLSFSTDFTAEPPTWLTGLTSITISNCRGGQGLLSSLTNLTSFKVSNSSCNVAMRKHLQQCTKLRELEISSCTIARGKPDIVMLAAKISSLTSLIINASQSLAISCEGHSGNWTSAYGELTQLKHLELVYLDSFFIKNPTDNWTNLTNLETLKIWNQTKLNEHWLDMLARITSLRHLHLDLDNIVDENHWHIAANLDLLPFTNLTKLTLGGFRSAWPNPWPINLKEIDCPEFSPSFPRNNLFDNVKISRLPTYILQQYNLCGYVLPKGCVKAVRFRAVDGDKTLLSEILDLDPECLEIEIASVNKESAQRLTTLFGDMSQMPKQVCIFLPGDYEKPAKKCLPFKEDIERILTLIQDKTQLILK